MLGILLSVGLGLAVVGIVIFVVIGIPIFFQQLAKENILFTTVKEGTIKAIMRGDSFERFIMSFAGYHLNDPTKTETKTKKLPRYKTEYFDEEAQENKRLPDWEVVYHGKGNKKGFKEIDDETYDDRSWLLRKLGLYWVGWPWVNNNVYVYAFEWNETSTNKEGKEKILPRAEATDFIFVADFTYAILTEEAETKDRLPVTVLTLVTVAIRNPYRALFSGEDWMKRVTAAINRHVRNFVGSKNFLDLISLKEKHWADFSQPIIGLSVRLLDDKDEPPYGLKGRYGAEIRTADLQTIELSGDAKKKNQESTTKEYEAKQEAQLKLIIGQAEADVIEKKGTREAEALGKRLKVIKEYGETGITLAGYDAIQESSKGPGNTIIWANNPLGPLAGIAEKLMNPEKKGSEINVRDSLEKNREGTSTTK